MKFKRIIPLISLSVVLILSACKKPLFQAYTLVKTQPPGGLQLDPGVFLPDDSLTALGLELGDVVDVVIGDTHFQANVYPYLYKEGEMGMNRFTLDRFQLTSGEQTVLIGKSEKPEIPVQRLEMHGESYPGDVEKWGHFVISAPHGDCDLFTGEIVKAMNTRYQIPTSAFIYPRFTFLGRWFDANRPLGKAPREDRHWTIPERIWNAEIDSVYRSYEKIIRSTAEVDTHQPLDFLCSFHGHDLKMKDGAGKRVNREVIEAYGSGFKLEEYRLMIDWFNELATGHFEEVPILVFGNLPEHQQYIIDDQSFNFWYTGLGTRSYGTLRKSNTTRGLHMETPNSMRFDPGAREKTIEIMTQFFQRIHTELLYPIEDCDTFTGNSMTTDLVVELPAVTINYRDAKLSVAAFKMNATEVSTSEFSNFINHQLDEDIYRVDSAQQIILDNQSRLVCHFDAYHPGDMLKYEKGIISVWPGREDYPMTNLSWHAASTYAQFKGGRLPTETEWVRAAGLWDDQLHTYAAEADDYKVVEQLINFEGSLDPAQNCSYPQDLPVASLKANPNGLYHLSGNVWEWCSDWFDSQYYRNLSSEQVTSQAQGPETGTMRTMKGGSWGAGLEVTKVSYRVALAPELSLPDLGFRIVWDI